MTPKTKKIIDWLILAGYVAFIYSTLSVAPSFSRTLSKLLGRNFNISVSIFILILVTGTIVVFYKRLKSRRPGVYIGLAAVFFTYLLFIFSWTGQPAERMHLVEYGFLSYLVLRVMDKIRPLVMKYFCVIMAVTAIGICDELIQWLLPNRVCDIKDMIFNAVSGVLALAVIHFLGTT